MHFILQLNSRGQMKVGGFHAICVDRRRQANMLVRPSQVFQANRAGIRRIVDAHRARNPRVFGSVARGDDTEQSDLDLLVDTTGVTSLFDIAAIELELERLMGIPVHVTTLGALRSPLRERVLAEAEAV